MSYSQHPLSSAFPAMSPDDINDPKDHVNYVCFFSNGTFKVGVSKNPCARLANYVREATRFGQKVTGLWVSSWRSKAQSLALESAVKHAYADCTILKHSETFDGGKAKGHEVVRCLRLSKCEKKAQDVILRKAYSQFGRYQASTAGQRAAILVVMGAV